MKALRYTLGTTVLLSGLACGGGETVPAVDLPAVWTEVIEQDGKRIILVPCHGELRNVMYMVSELNFQNELDAAAYAVDATETTASGWRLTTRSRDSEGNATGSPTPIEITWVDQAAGLARWSGNGIEMTAVEALHESGFPKIEQPPEQCQ